MALLAADVQSDDWMAYNVQVRSSMNNLDLSGQHLNTSWPFADRPRNSSASSPDCQ